MSIREKIKLLTDVDVDTENYALLLLEPEKHVASPEDAKKLKDLFELLDDVRLLERSGQ